MPMIIIMNPTEMDAFRRCRCRRRDMKLVHSSSIKSIEIIGSWGENNETRQLDCCNLLAQYIVDTNKRTHEL